MWEEDRRREGKGEEVGEGEEGGGRREEGGGKREEAGGKVGRGTRT
jgi:hypothetical protein